MQNIETIKPTESPSATPLSAMDAVLLMQPPELFEVIPLSQIEPIEFRQPCAANAEIFDSIAEIMTQARATAEIKLEENRQRLRDGEYEAVPLDVDALGTASKVVEIGRNYGKGSPEYKQAEQGLLQDKDRRLDEAESKNTYRYFEPIAFDYDAETDTVYADGLSYDEMMEVGGLSPIGEAEEVARRPHDYAKGVLNKHLIQNPDSERIAVLHQSSCPDWAIEAYDIDPKGGHGGYAPKYKKRMINFDTFDPKEGKIYHEQVAVPGNKVTEEVVNEGYRRIGVTEEGQELNKSELYGLHSIVQKEVITEALDFVAILDEIASEVTGENIFMGETVSDDHPKDYQQVKQEAQAEKEKRRQRAEQLKNYTIDLAERGVNHAMATVMEDKFVQDLLLDEAQKEPEIAVKAFDDETAAGFEMAMALQAQGRYQEAQDIIDMTRLNAPAAGGCGAGSCGLRDYDPTKPMDQLARIQLNTEEGDSILKDNVRTCKCGGTIYYKNNEKKKSYSKICMDCGAFEKDGRTIREGNAKDRRQQKLWTSSISKYSKN